METPPLNTRETTSRSFLAQEVSATAHDAAYRLRLDPALESLDIEAANSKFTVSRKPLSTTLWQFDFEGERFYLGPTL